MARETHDLGKLYTHGMIVPTGGPLVELGTSHEVEEPWRVGRCVVLRLWKWAIVLGWWGAPRTREEMVLAEGTHNGIVPSPPNAVVTTASIRADFRPEPGHQLLPEGWKVV